MEYKGKLYGKIANKYIDLEFTANDFDRLVEESHQKTIDKLKLIEAMAKFQHQKELMIHVLADPVVLQPVKGGYLIITAWGDEASDELVVNQKFN